MSAAASARSDALSGCEELAFRAGDAMVAAAAPLELRGGYNGIYLALFIYKMVGLLWIRGPRRPHVGGRTLDRSHGSRGQPRHACRKSDGRGRIRKRSPVSVLSAIIRST